MNKQIYKKLDIQRRIDARFTVAPRHRNTRVRNFSY